MPRAASASRMRGGAARHVGAQTMAEWELSVRRSRARRRVLLMLASLSESFPRPLALACGLDASRLDAIMRGRPPAYRVELSLVGLGLAVEVWTPNGRMYAITTLGRRKARQLSARVARQGARRSAP